MIHLSYTRRDLPQQLVQLDHLTQELYDRMSPAHRYLLEIEPPREATACSASRSGRTRAGGTDGRASTVAVMAGPDPAIAQFGNFEAFGDARVWARA